MRTISVALGSRLGGLAYRAAAAAACRLPRCVARALGRAAGLACWALQARRRAVVRGNLRLARPGRPRPRSRHAFERFGESVVDTLRLAGARSAEIEQRVRFSGLPALERAARRRGAVLLAAHAGNWEWAGAALAARGLAVTALARPHAAGAQRFFDELRARLGVRTCASLAPLAEASAAPVVALFCDRVPPGSGRRSPERAACAALALAARRGWSAFPGVALAVPGGYRVHLGPEIPPAHSRRARRAAARRALRFLAAHLERDPGQWFAFEPLAWPARVAR